MWVGYSHFMKQVIVIHGGDSFATYEEYLQFLKDIPIEIGASRKGWKAGLAEVLGEEYEVIQPSMPNKQNARYPEWELWFEKHVPFMQDGVVLVGHSLGGSFLAKYLSEKRLPISILGTFLVAAPYNLDGDHNLVDFAAPDSLELLAEQGGEIFLYHSTDDPVVEFSELAKYQAALPNAQARIFDDRQHFNQEDFPELVSDIRSLGK